INDRLWAQRLLPRRLQDHRGTQLGEPKAERNFGEPAARDGNLGSANPRPDQPLRRPWPPDGPRFLACQRQYAFRSHASECPAREGVRPRVATARHPTETVRWSDPRPISTGAGGLPDG